MYNADWGVGSGAVSGLIGGFHQQAMQGMAMSNMIGLNAGRGADSLMGGIMSAGGGMGGSLLKGGMGMLGLDPMSLGMNAGIKTLMGGGGLTGAVGAAMGAALPMAGAMAVGSYAGNQMMMGGQQQMMLNNTLRNSFNFQGPNGQGFDRASMTQIGGMMREMTHSFGPNGEMVNMQELTNIAGKMGQGGMMRGVKEVQEFSRKFKEMVDAAKTMARDLGTTLEGAVEFASSMRQSGMFKVADQVKFTGMARNMAVAGNISVEEVMQGAQAGSYISRSVGGLGRHGMVAGAKMAGQIGTAMQIGALSDDDVFNATGLSGSAGRMAMGQAMLQRDASFLTSGRGRRVLAQVAGMNGTIDEGAVASFMNGGFGIGETMSRDQERLGMVGRANFIRNEGRLRGAMLEKFGGNIQAMALSGWAGSKGLSISDLSDDRTALFAQRQLGMGRDEFESAMKMAKALPMILKEQQNAQQDADWNRRAAEHASNTGLEGVKKRFSHAKEQLNGNLQKMGQDIFNEGANYIERWANTISDQYVRVLTKDSEDAWRAGVAGNVSAFNSQFGLNRMFGQEKMSGLGGARSTTSLMGAFNGNTSGMMGGPSQRKQLEKSGFSFTGISTDEQLDQRLQQINRMRAGALSASSEAELMAAMPAELETRKFLAYSAQGLKGEKLIEGYESYLKSKTAGEGGNQALKAWYGKFKDASLEQKNLMMRDATRIAGAGYDTYSKGMGKDFVNVFQGAGDARTMTDRYKDMYHSYFGTEEDFFGDTAMGGAMKGAGKGWLYGATGWDTSKGAWDNVSAINPLGKAVQFGKDIGGGVGGLVTGNGEGGRFGAGKRLLNMGINSLGFGAVGLGRKLYSSVTEDSATGAANAKLGLETGQWLLGKEHRRLVENLYSDDPSKRAQGLINAEKWLAEHQGFEAGSLEAKKSDALRQDIAGVALLEAEKAYGRQLTDAEIKQIATEKGISPDSLKDPKAFLMRSRNMAQMAYQGEGRKQALELQDKLATRAQETLQGLTSSGSVKYVNGQLQLSGFKKGMGSTAFNELQSQLDILEKGSKLKMSGDLEGYRQLMASRDDNFMGMSVEEKRKTIKDLEGSGNTLGYQRAGELNAIFQNEEKVKKMVRTGRGGSAVEEGFGITLDKQAKARLARLGVGNNAAMAEQDIEKAIVQQMGAGVLTKDLKGDIKAVVEDMKKAGGGAGAADIMSKLMEKNPELAKARAEQKEKQDEAANPALKYHKEGNELLKNILDRFRNLPGEMAEATSRKGNGEDKGKNE